MPKISLPDLTFQGVEYGPRETPLNLTPLLYRGGAGTDIRKFASAVNKGILGLPLLDRLPLLIKVHDTIQGILSSGGSRFTAKTSIHAMRQFFAWADNLGYSPALSSAEEIFIEWTEHLLSRQRSKRDLKTATIASKATTVSSLLDQALELKVGLYRRTRIPKRYNKKKVLGTQADKVKLSDSFTFGNALLDISNALTSEKIRGSLPVEIRFRTGQVLEEWSGLTPARKVKYLNPGYGSANGRKRVKEARDRWESDSSWNTRYPLLNLRIQSEMLIFISQTGMNLAQANKLKFSKCTFQSYLDGYQVRRIYKGRRQGEIAFEIFSEYRSVFENYLKWRSEMFPGDEDGLLFPDSSPQQRSLDRAPNFYAIKKRCKELGIRYISPRELRKTRINWLTRKSRDPMLTAEMAQHTQETLLRIYDQPHHQSAISEISRFHSLADPAYEPPGPGACVTPTPAPEADSPPKAPPPNCLNPAGCLFCDNHRDIDDADHIWSLASYRHYKSLELMLSRPSFNGKYDNPAFSTIERITEKLKSFEISSEVRALWVSEAINRVEEGDYHPKWDGFIRLIEVRA